MRVDMSLQCIFLQDIYVTNKAGMSTNVVNLTKVRQLKWKLNGRNDRKIVSSDRWMGENSEKISSVVLLIY